MKIESHCVKDNLKLMPVENVFEMCKSQHWIIDTKHNWVNELAVAENCTKFRR